MNKDNPANDLANVTDLTAPDVQSFEEISEGDIVECDINLRLLRSKAHISVDGPIAVASEALDEIHENIKEKVDKRYATQSGQKIGTISIQGDGTVHNCEVDEKYMRR